MEKSEVIGFKITTIVLDQILFFVARAYHFCQCRNHLYIKHNHIVRAEIELSKMDLMVVNCIYCSTFLVFMTSKHYRHIHPSASIPTLVVETTLHIPVFSTIHRQLMTQDLVHSELYAAGPEIEPPNF